jgi:hypothetical protein
MPSKAARLRRRAERRKRAERRTEPLPALHTAGWDGTTEVLGQPGIAVYDATTIKFTGISGTGLPDADVTAVQAPAPPRALPAGRERPVIGDALALDPHWGPKLAMLPCGHCGDEGTPAAGVLERTYVIGYLNRLAWDAGWTFDTDLIWTCPQCQQGDAWKARQGVLELHRFDELCDRHSGLGGDRWPHARCTCPGAVLAVDVMLASEDYLGSGRGRHAAGAR